MYILFQIYIKKYIKKYIYLYLKQKRWSFVFYFVHLSASFSETIYVTYYKTVLNISRQNDLRFPYYNKKHT